MENSDFQEIMQDSLNEITTRINLIFNYPESSPITLMVVYKKKSPLAVKRKVMFYALGNYFLGAFEALVFAKLVKKHDFVVNLENRDQFLVNFNPFFESFKKEVGKITPTILDYFINSPFTKYHKK